MRPAFFSRFYLVAYLLFLSIPSQTFASVNSFGGFYRYPAEERAWMPMGTDPTTGTTAYFRDWYVGGQTIISGATDGETWSASMRKADGTTTNWGTLKFSASYAGGSNCFYGLVGWFQCGGTSIQITWYLLAQCAPDGTWTMSFTNNGSTFTTQSFTLLPKIPPGKVPDFKQASYSDAYDHICYVLQNPLDPRTRVKSDCTAPGAQPYTIADKGCFLSDVANIFSYHGLSAINPSNLNTALNQNSDGYNEEGGVRGDTAAQIAITNNVAMTFIRSNSTDITSLRTAVCTYGPQMVGISKNGIPNRHWLTATGVDQTTQTIWVNDPGSAVAPMGIPATAVTGARKFAGREYSLADRSGITISFHSPGELLLTNPAGQRTGLDPLTNNRYNEIPESFYDSIGLDDATTGDPGPEIKELAVGMPLEGEYVLTVTGTGAGTYTLEMSSSDINGDSFPGFKARAVPLSIGSIQSYAFNYSKNPAAPTEFTGGFDGAGQRPRDVNKFLSYSNPTSGRTALPTGTTVFPLMIFYGKTTVPSTFKAILNGVDISARFSPVAGGFQTVNLNLQRGSNVLKTSIDGSVGTRTATDSDRLVFDVP